MTQTAHGVEFTQHLSETSKSAEERAAILANPGFGDYFTDHTAIVDYSVDAEGKGGWHDARIEPYGPIMLDPAAAVLHYGQEIFEGLKAYRHADGGVWTFRPEANAERVNKSGVRLALPAKCPTASSPRLPATTPAVRCSRCPSGSPPPTPVPGSAVPARPSAGAI